MSRYHAQALYLGRSLPWRVRSWNAQPQNRPSRGQNPGQFFVSDIVLGLIEDSQSASLISLNWPPFPSSIRTVGPDPVLIRQINVHRNKSSSILHSHHHSSFTSHWDTEFMAACVLGLVSEQKSEGAEDKQDLGAGQHHGRVRAVRGHGEALPPPPRHHHQAVRDRRVCRALAPRWVAEYFMFISL